MASEVPDPQLLGDWNSDSDEASCSHSSGFRGDMSSLYSELDSKDIDIGSGYGAGVFMLSCAICSNLLTDPVQLDCLHNSCRQCIDRTVADQGTSSITCHMCREVSDTTGRRDNAFIEFLVQQHRTAVEPPRCDFCIEEGTSEQLADLWCNHCEKYLCHDCSPGHRKYNKHHTTSIIQEMTKSTPDFCSLGAATQLCRIHKKSMDHLCIQCELPKCYDCGLACSSMQHDLQFLKSPKTGAFLSRIKQEIENFDKLLQDKADALKLSSDLMDGLQAARKEHMETLQRNKKLVVESVDRVYQAAEGCLQDTYDNLMMKAQELAQTAKTLQLQAIHAVRYAQNIGGSADVASLIQQQKVLRTRLQVLTEKVKAVHKPLGAADCISIEASATSTADMEALVRSWIGVPKRATDDLCNKLPGDEDRTKQSSQTGQVGATPTVVPMPRATLFRAPSTSILSAPTTFDFFDDDSDDRFGYAGMLSSMENEIQVMRVAADSLELEDTERCYDVAATSHSTVLVAQGNAGLLEYNFVDNEETTVWKPKQPTSVTAVDVADDRCIVVGLRKSQQRLAVLTRTRDNTSWNVARYIKIARYDDVECDPFTLAVHADLVAVSLWHKERQSGADRPGPTLVLLSLSRGTELLRQDLGYNIFSVAVTERTVATSSWGRDRPGRDAIVLQDYRVTGYNHRGSTLWLRCWEDRVYGICAAPAGRVLYLAIRGTNTVTAIREDNGNTLMDIVVTGMEITDPWRLSVTKGRGPAVLAVLESNFKTMTMYPVVAYTRTD